MPPGSVKNELLPSSLTLMPGRLPWRKSYSDWAIQTVGAVKSNKIKKDAICIPLFGKLIEESHYLTNSDTFVSDLWPKDPTKDMDSHLKRTFKLDRKIDITMTFEKLYYKFRYKERTAEERAYFGQGLTGSTQLEKLCPETGSADKKFIGGITREVYAWPGTNSKSEISVSFLESWVPGI